MRWIGLLALLALFLPSAAASQAEEVGAEATASTASEGEGVFFETVEVNVVNVEVYVTDRKGDRVTGLTREDFEIYEDGRPVAITNFFAVENGEIGGGVAETAVPAEQERLPERIGSAAPSPMPEEQLLHLVVYIDNFNIRPFNRNRVFRRLRDFLDRNVSRHDRVMLVSYDRSLHIRQPFTSDPGLINSALFELEKVTGHGVHADSERRDILRQIQEAESYIDVTLFVRQYAESLANDLAFTIGSLKEFVNSLAGLPGRKAILYVSDGLPMTPGEDVYYALQQKFDQNSILNEVHRFNASRRFRELAAQANANRVTFYTIDASGLRTYSSASVEQSIPGFGAYIDSIEISNLQSTLRYLADTTGGLAIVNTNDVGPGLDKIARDLDSYYSLGYTPPHSGDGRYHKIEVKVRERKGLVVRHREGYRDKTSEARMADSTLSTLIYGVQDNPLAVHLEVGEPQRRDDGFFLVPLAVKIPLGQLVLVPHSEVHEGRLRLWVAARDREGGMSPVEQVPIPITIPNSEVDAARQQYYLYEMTLLMRRGEHDVAVGVRDDLGAQASFLRKPVYVGS